MSDSLENVKMLVPLSRMSGCEVRAPSFSCEVSVPSFSCEVCTPSFSCEVSVPSFSCEVCVPSFKKSGIFGTRLGIERDLLSLKVTAINGQISPAMNKDDHILYLLTNQC